MGGGVKAKWYLAVLMAVLDESLRRHVRRILRPFWTQAILLVTILAGLAIPRSACSMGAGTPAFEKQLLILRNQSDIPSIIARLKGKSSSLASIHKAVVEDLERTKTVGQATIIPLLDKLKSDGHIQSYHAFFVANCISVEADADAFEELRSNPEVAGIEPDFRLELIGDTLPDPPDPVASISSGLIAIRAPQVWAMGITGAGVIVSHMDTGVNGTHPALAGKWRGSYGFPASSCWLDLYGSSTTPVDLVGHGTQTMGIICGSVPGDTIGVAWGARYISSRLNLSNGNSTVTTALMGFEWLLDPDGNPGTFDDVPRVVSLSWGLDAAAYPPCYNVLDMAIDNCEAAGIAVLWAAGNEGDHGPGSVRIPANRAVSEVSSFAVGAYNLIVDSIWSLSSRGPSSCTTDPNLAIKPEIVAPGTSVRSSYFGTSYANGTGTSFSVPHAAGTLALMIEANPTLPPDSLKRILTLTAVDKGVPGNDNTYGYGELDALSAVMGAINGVGWVEGHVTDLYGTEIAATTTIAGDPHHTVTDASGRFYLAMPADMPFTLQVTAPTFRTYTQSVTLTARDTLALEIVLTVADTRGILTGMVTNCLGLPASGAQIWAANAAVPGATARPDGHFHLILPQGTWNILASDGWCATGSVPGVQIAGGGITDIEIVLPSNPDYLCSNADPYGYRACDNNDPGGPVYSWDEIAPAVNGKGVVHNLSDGSMVPIALPFAARFYGTDWNKLYLNPKGNVSFGLGFTERVNIALPRLYTPLIFPFWDDLYDLGGGDLCTYYDASQGAFIVEWWEMPHYSGGGIETFQLLIYNPAVMPTATGDAVLEMRYNSVDTPDQCTVGIDGDGGGNYLQYVYNGSYDPHASPLVNGRAIRFAPGTLSGGVADLTIVNPELLLQVPPGQSVDTALILTNPGSGPLAYAVSVAGETGQNSYSWITSQMPGGPAYEFMDISGIGTPTGVTADDSTSDPLPLPWLFRLFGQYFDRAAICSNGWISFTSCLNAYSWQAGSLSDQHDPFYMLAPYWTDLDPTHGGTIYGYFDAANDRYIYQWSGVPRFGSASPNTFQIVLHHDGTLDFVYGAMAAPLNSGTVGVKGRNGEYVQLAYNQPFVQSNMLVRFFHPDTAAAQCVIVDAQQGIMPPAGSVRVPLRLRNNRLSFGESSWSLNVASSDPQATRPVASVALQNMPDPALLHVTIAPNGDTGVLLRWNSVVAPSYCVYSGSAADGALTHFEASIADTFIVLPYTTDSQRCFEVRLCDSPSNLRQVKDGPSLQEKATKR
jgi:hypothetical protein